jgi:hypothetical protein
MCQVSKVLLPESKQCSQVLQNHMRLPEVQHCLIISQISYEQAAHGQGKCHVRHPPSQHRPTVRGLNKAFYLTRGLIHSLFAATFPYENLSATLIPFMGSASAMNASA